MDLKRKREMSPETALETDRLKNQQRQEASEMYQRRLTDPYDSLGYDKGNAEQALDHPDRIRRRFLDTKVEKAKKGPHLVKS